MHNIARGVKRLYRSGVSNIIVLGLPEIDVLPDSVVQYNQRLSHVLAKLDERLKYSDIRYFDTNSLFQQILFAKIVPNCKKLGLLDAADGWLRDRFTDIGVIQFEDMADTGEEYEEFSI